MSAYLRFPNIYQPLNKKATRQALRPRSIRRVTTRAVKEACRDATPASIHSILRPDGAFLLLFSFDLDLNTPRPRERLQVQEGTENQQEGERR